MSQIKGGAKGSRRKPVPSERFGPRSGMIVWSLRKSFTQEESRDWDGSDVPESCGGQGPRQGPGSFWFRFS